MKSLVIRLLYILFTLSPLVAQVFPGGTAGDRDLFVAVAGVSTTLTVPITAASVTFSVASSAKMVPNELLTIESEILLVCSVTGNQVAVGYSACPNIDGRGIGGSGITGHSNGARVQDLIVPPHHNNVRLEVIAIERALGANLSNVPGTPAGPATPIIRGGTGAVTQGNALTNILGIVPPTSSVCFGQGMAPMTCPPTGPAGTVLTSNGTTADPSWQMASGGGAVSSVFGRTGTVVAVAGDYTAAQVVNAVDQSQMYNNPPWLATLAFTKVTGVPSFVANPMMSAGDFIVGGTGGTPQRLAVPGTGTFCPNWAAGVVTWVSCPGSGTAGLTSVGISMPSAFNVSGSPLTTNGVIAVTGAGTATQYITGQGQLATLPVTSVFGRTGAILPVSGDYTTAQVTEMTNLYFTNARVYSSLSATPPIMLNATTGNISCTACGGGSVFTGSIAVPSAFSTTPTFSLADVAPTRSPVRFEPSVMTASVDGVTFTNKPAGGGGKFSIVWLQGTSGGFKVNYGASITSGNPCQISPTANVWTEQFFEVAADGVSIYVTGCHTNELPFAILGAPERIAPPTAATGLANLWPDPNRHTWVSNQNASSNQHIMPRCAGTTDQCASADLSDAANIALLSSSSNVFTGVVQLQGGLILAITGNNSQCLQSSPTGLVGGTGFPCSGVSVNGTSLSNPDFNGTAPPANANNINVTWQTSGSSVSAQVQAVPFRTGLQPACSVTTRSSMWFILGGPGIADLFQLCMKSNTDTYSWVTVTLP